jgi:glutamyl-tRNA reductase
MRQEEAKKVEVIIDEEFSLLLAQYKQQKADALISELYSQIYGLRQKELEKAVNKLRAYHTLGEIELNVLDDLTRSIANKLLAEPTKALRHAAQYDDEEFLDSVSKLFDIRTYQRNDEKDECQ